MGLFGPPNVEKLKAKKDINGLIKALAYQNDNEIRKAAAIALGEIGGASAVHSLMFALKDTDVKAVILAALVQIGEPTVNWLTNYPLDNEGIKILEKIGSYEAIQMLMAEANHVGNKETKSNAIEALVRIGGPAVEQIIDRISISYSSLEGYVEVLGRVGGENAVRLLCDARERGSRDVRRNIVICLGNIGGKKAAATLIDLLKDKDWSVRSEAAKFLGYIGDQEAVAPLINLLKDGNSSVVMAAVESLNRLGNSTGVEALIPLLKHEYDAVRLLIVESLGKMGDQSAVEPLFTSLTDESLKVRLAAAIALDELGWQPDQGKHGADYWIVRRRWNSCVQIGANAVEPLLAALESDDGEVRKEIIVALNQIGDHRAVKPLIRKLTDEDYTIRKKSAAGLVALYQSGKLNAQTQRLILAQKAVITEKHTDKVGNHDDRSSSQSDCTHSDYPHNDSGIGINFPV
jgi:HEAT repeat protein